jgi:electron transport complex protein RnfE
MGLGFVFALFCLGSIREILGNGSFFNVPLFGEGFEPWVVMILPPGGFFTLGFLLLFFAWYEERKIKRKAHRNSIETTEKDMRYG